MPTGKPYQANDKDRGKLEVLLEMDLPLQQIAQRIGVSIPTLQKHYGDVIEATGLRPGPKTFQPSDEQRRLVTALAGFGLPHGDIAEVIGLSKGSLQTHFREELDLGRIRANFEIAKNLYKMATGPTNERTTLTAAIWWTKVRMGWRATTRVENTGKDGGRIRTKRKHGTVVILPDNGRGDARVSQPPMTDRILLQDNRHSNANEGGLSANEGDPELDEKEFG